MARSVTTHDKLMSAARWLADEAEWLTEGAKGGPTELLDGAAHAAEHAEALRQIANEVAVPKGEKLEGAEEELCDHGGTCPVGCERTEEIMLGCRLYYSADRDKWRALAKELGKALDRCANADGFSSLGSAVRAADDTLRKLDEALKDEAVEVPDGE